MTFNDMPNVKGAGEVIQITQLEDIMKLSEPKQITFWIAVILAVLGILAELLTIPGLSGFAFWLVVIGFIVLFLGNILKGF